MNDIPKLIGQLPKRFTLARKIKNRLNEKGLKTTYGRQYTEQNVYNALNLLHEDENVVLELIDIVEEHKNKKTFLSIKINNVLAI